MIPDDVMNVQAAEKIPTLNLMAQRIRDAKREERPLDQMLLQLRQIVAGPTERVFEARIEEVLDILEELKIAGDQKNEAVKVRVEDVATKTARLEQQLLNLDRALLSLSDQVVDGPKQLAEAFGNALDESRSDLETRLNAMSNSMSHAFDGIDGKVTAGLRELSTSLSKHIVEADLKRQRDQEQSRLSLEQRIAQWRAEIEDMRRKDIDEVATSMMDVGERFRSLRAM